ncbi:MAG TPA: hypothetical protein VL025_15285, partial [Thermoanaerobaculia bacterium]|nr:hypothetical protein [Thermoanaerobaculia bacterium]
HFSIWLLAAHPRAVYAHLGPMYIFCIETQTQLLHTASCSAQAVQVFNGLKIGREETAAIFLLRHVAEKEQETAKLLDIVSQVAAFLRRAEHDPNARFDPVIR